MTAEVAVCGPISQGVPYHVHAGDCPHVSRYTVVDVARIQAEDLVDVAVQLFAECELDDWDDDTDVRGVADEERWVDRLQVYPCTSFGPGEPADEIGADRGRYVVVTDQGVTLVWGPMPWADAEVMATGLRDVLGADPSSADATVEVVER